MRKCGNSTKLFKEKKSNSNEEEEGKKWEFKHSDPAVSAFFIFKKRNHFKGQIHAVLSS